MDKKSNTNDLAALRRSMQQIEQEREHFQRTTHPGAQWFGAAGMGLFLHWGISCVHGGIDLSWGMFANTHWDADQGGRNKISPTEYFKLAEHFNPDHYDPDLWLQAAAKAGFKYAVLTTRHCDGYAMWPSEYGEFGVRTHLGGRDLVQPYVDACRRNGLKVGLYYSPPDWYYDRHYMSFNFASLDPNSPVADHRDYDIDLRPTTLQPKPEGWEEDYHLYVRGQVIELLTRYAPVDVMWFDGGPAVISIEEIRSYNPAILVNPRMHGYGDFLTPERKMPDGPVDGWWELCDIWPECSWGYEKIGGERYKSLDWFLSQLRQIHAWGGNYLIDVGPRPDGTLPDAYYQRMAELTAAGGLAAVK